MPVWAVALVAIGVLAGVLATVALARARDAAARGGSVPDADPWFVLGVGLAGAGSALVATIGIGMIGILVAGLAFMGVGRIACDTGSERRAGAQAAGVEAGSGAEARTGWRKSPSGTGAPTRSSATCHDGEEPSAQRRNPIMALPTRIAPGHLRTPRIRRSRTGIVATAAANISR